MSTPANSNVHVVLSADGHWTVAVEGVGRVTSCVSREAAIETATALALENRVVLYVHQRDGQFDWWKDFGDGAAPP
ncbi:DUF2188 domain-containing protein [Cupriavidus sp. 30B13]|uniref:DUF2188 domain-containing protein n=1 Tax=Cupriavidus sp. 30B13 TaxID=3384241 RepID=UPI003B8F5716